MNKEEIKDYALNFFKQNNIEVADSAIQELEKERHIKSALLEEYSEDEIKEGLDKVLEISKQKYEKRKNNRKSEVKLTKVEVRGALRSKSAQIPPFIKPKVEEPAEGEGEAGTEEKAEGGEA